MKKEKNGENYDLIVLGGGPAGMMCAGVAGSFGARVLLLEKNNRLGVKLSLTGGGRCNITNDKKDIKVFLEKFAEDKKFLYSPFSKFSVKDTFTFFEKLGLPLVSENRDRVFPQSQKASDVVLTLEKFLRKNNVKVLKNKEVKSLRAEGDKIISVQVQSGEVFRGENFALGTGGLAYPETGSSGDGFKILKKLGHHTLKSSPNLVPLKTQEAWTHSLSGLSLSFVKIKFLVAGKAQIKKTGKILFTHFGISGPMILNLAFEVKKFLQKKEKVSASLDLFPDTEENALNRRVWRLFEQHKNKKLKNVLPILLPKRLAEEILENVLPQNTKLSPGWSDKSVHEISKEERSFLVKSLKNLPFEITGTLGMDKAIVADGGLLPEEVNFQNMTSKLFPNLYLLGDTLNINRPSGGYSLQLCWTTGFVAGKDVGEKYKK